jgi:hypothetical protein
MKALLRLIGACFILAIVVMGILAAAALKAISREVAVYLALAVFVVGVIVFALVFGPALSRRNRKHGEDEPN